jgi:hypothetical protein
MSRVIQQVLAVLPRQEGLYMVGGKYFRVVKLFDICTARHEDISKGICKKIEGCVYVGECTIIYEYDAELGRAVVKEYSSSHRLGRR